MRKKNLQAGILAVLMGATSVFGVTTTAAAEETSSIEVNHDTELEITVYSCAANYAGLQTGWFAQLIKEKFNITLNIIAPNVSGDSASLYQTRAASGNLGDIIILDTQSMLDCIDAGLVADISDIIYEFDNLSTYQEQIDVYNDAIEVGEEGATYAIPANMQSVSPTSYVETTVYSAPRIPWDFYSELGNPEMETVEDLLEVLAAIQEAHPTNEDGDSAYALSLWSDWDGDGGISNAVEIAKWFGQESNGSLLIGNDNTMTSLTDSEGGYYKALKFLNMAYQMGLVDPDSATQDWNTACAKMQTKRVYLFWYNWQRGFWNTPERGEEGSYYIAVPVSELNIFQTSDDYYGDGNAWAIGSQVDEETKLRIMEFLDWLASPEGKNSDYYVGIIYTENEDGTFTLTDVGTSISSVDVEVDEEFGGGSYNDGANQINTAIIANSDIDPRTGEPYDSTLWSSTLEANQVAATIEWSELYDAENEVEYYQENGQLTIIPSVNLVLESDTTDIALIRSECGTMIQDYSWQMIYASSDEEFEALWESMCTTLNGLGWEELVAFDMEKYQPVIDARLASEE